jgi:hypothetical protein
VSETAKILTVELPPTFAPPTPLNIVGAQELQNKVLDELCRQVGELKGEKTNNA